MKVRPVLALLFWLVILALLGVILVLGLRNGAADMADAVALVALFAFGTVGPLIVVRRPDHRIGWLFCLDVLVNTGASAAHEVVQYTVVTQPVGLRGAQWLAWIVSWIGDTGWVLLFTFTFLLFPTGRLPSRRWRPLAWLIAASLVFHTLVTMLRPGPFDEWPALSNPLGLPVPPRLLGLDTALGNWVVFMVLASITSLVWRYRMSRGEQRQQIKWIAYVAAILGILIGIQAVVERGRPAAPLLALFDLLLIVAFTVFPVAVGLSILRYRLWDIDVIIRRTLIYSALTAVLALAYIGSVLVLESVFRALTGQGQNSLVVVLSTLGIAALFVPVRKQLQAVIDRRFYRRTVDAAQTLATFSTAARDEVDLDRLSEALLDSVRTSFQPAHVSLWLPKDPGHPALPPQR